jgi:hypothetical protein
MKRYGLKTGFAVGSDLGQGELASGELPTAFDLVGRLLRAEDGLENLSGDRPFIPFHLEAIIGERQPEVGPLAARDRTGELTEKLRLGDRRVRCRASAGRDLDFARSSAAVSVVRPGPAA